MEWMELLEQSLLAFFAAVGIAWTVWTVAGALFLSKREKLETVVALVPVAQDAPALERTVAGLSWTTICGQKFDRILIADCGLDEEGREVARRLARQNAAVALCTMDSAATFL